MSRLIIVFSGPRACGKSFAASRLAREIRGAIVLEEDPYEHLGEAVVHSRQQHVYPAFVEDVAGNVVLHRDALDRLRGARVVIVVARTHPRTKARLVEQIVPGAIISLAPQVGVQPGPLS